MSDNNIKNLENIIMIIIWFTIFCGGTILIATDVLSITNLGITITHVIGFLFGFFCIGASLYYLNKRILGGLK
jgi:hypothetical protein